MVFIPKHIKNIVPYKAGKPIQEVRRELKGKSIAKLGSNENTLGSSPKAIEAIKREILALQWYPEPSCLDIRAAFAKLNKVSLENVIVANGSEGVLSYILKTFLEPGDEVLTSKGTFIGLYLLAQVYNLPCTCTPLTKKYAYDLEAILEGISKKTKLIYLANPNNPTGTAFQKSDFENFMDKVPEHIIVVLDEAYHEYAIDLMKDYPIGSTYTNKNLITLRTFSKIYGLAGLRLGYGVGCEKLIKPILKVKLPFEPSILAQVGGIAAISDTDFLQKTLDNNKNSLNYFSERLQKMNIHYVPSVANFVMIDLYSAKKVHFVNEQLIKRGVIIRPLSPFGLETCLRISTGTSSENKQCMDALESIFS